jgi:tetratricopeptide (TPR) repeat protein
VIELDALTGREARLAQAAEHLAESYEAGARFDSALFYFERSFEHYRSVADKYAARRVRLAKAALHHRLGEDREALSLVAEMSRIAEVLGDAQGVTELNWHLLPLFRTLGRTDDENRVLTQLLDDAAASGNSRMQSRVYSEWGLSYYDRGEFNSAAENFLRAFTLAGQAGDSLQSVFALARLAQTYEQAGRRPDAFQTYTDALVLADQTKGSERLREDMLIHIGNIYLSGGQFTEGERFYSAALQSAIARNDKLIEGYLWLQLGHCAVGRAPRSADSRRNYQIALDLFTSYSYAPGIRYAHASFALDALKAGKHAVAYEHLSTAMRFDSYPRTPSAEWEIPPDCENAFFRLQGSTPEEAYLEVLLILGQYPEAFAEADRMKTTHLAETASPMSLEAGGQETTAALWEAHHNQALLRGALRQLGGAISAFPDNRFLVQEVQGGIETYRNAAANAAGRVTDAENKALGILAGNQGATIQAVQAALRDDAAILTYVPTTRSTFVYLVGKKSWTVQLSALGKTRLSELRNEFLGLTVDTRVDSMQGSGELRTGKRTAEVAGILYNALLWPVESSLRNFRRVIVVPYEEVIPFHALRRPRRSAQFLIEQMQVSYLPSASSILSRKPALPLVVNIAGVGHPGTTSWDVEYELRDIRAFHKEARLYFGKDATLATLQRERASILNLAAEFHFDPDRTGNSFFRLSDGTPAGSTEIPWGKLLTLPAYPTVVLSDLGQHSRIPTVKPLLFLVAGSESVILTSSPARRKTKKYFGELFYTAIAGGTASDEAYRQAILGMIANPEVAAMEVWSAFFRWGI